MPHVEIEATLHVDSGSSFRLDFKLLGESSWPLIQLKPEAVAVSAKELSQVTIGEWECKGKRGRERGNDFNLLNAKMLKMALRSFQAFANDCS